MKLTFLAAVAACGCAEHTAPSSEFAEQGSVRAPQRMAEIQRANGARADGNLHAVHFTGDAVNSLGREKLDTMLRDDESVRPLLIHMASASDREVLIRRIDSVTAYLMDNGLNEQQLRFSSGPNEASYHPSAPDLANLRKTDTGSPTDAAPPSGSSSFGVSGAERP